MILETLKLYLLPNFILIGSVIFVWHNLLKKRVNFRDYRLYVTLISIMIISIINYLVVEKFIRICLVTIVLMIFFKFLFKSSVQKAIITPILSQLLILVSESIFVVILSLILQGKFMDFMGSYIGMLSTNVSVAAMIFVFSKMKFMQKIYSFSLKLTEKIKRIQLIPLCLVLLIVLSIADMAIYYKIKFEYLFIFNISIILICTIIIVYSLITQNRYNKVSDKYNIAIKSLNDYEDMMTKYRLTNHENKNLLLTIRAMVVNKDKDIPKYIDSLIEEKYLDDEKLLFKVSSIPSGGLRATIYSEILKIKESKINYSLNIDRDIKTVDFIELDTSTVVDICKIIGVFIDNSIEALKGLKTKNIDISLYLEDKKLCIKVSNNYKGKINFDKINDAGYTTKGSGHGYGLALVKKIISENNDLENKTEVSKDIFSQLIFIKYKKTH